MINREYLQSLSKGTSKNQELLTKILDYAEEYAKAGHNRVDFSADSDEYTEYCVKEVVDILKERYQLSADYKYRQAQEENEFDVFIIAVGWHCYD